MSAALLSVRAEHPGGEDARALMDELSNVLAPMTGDDGRASFDIADAIGDRACFAIARDACGRALGCGALRPIDAHTAEVKRMFARTGNGGVGSAVLGFLEAEAGRLGYAVVRLETRLVNTNAVAFYERRGYVRIPNYGRYVGNAKAVCFEKVVIADGAAPRVRDSAGAPWR